MRVRRSTACLPDGREIHYYGAAAGTPHPGAGPPAVTAASSGSELRWDPWEEQWVVIAAHRQDRGPRPGAAYCPLCPSTATQATEIPAGSYEVVVFDNRFPALPPATVAARHGDGAPRPAAGGRCEVICYTDDHDVPLSGLPLSRLRTVIDAWADRTASLNALSDVAQVFCFENRGAQVGATLAHPHGQIYAYPFVPTRLRHLLAVASRRWESRRECLACVTLRQERADPIRVVAGGSDWTAFVPYAARWPYEVRLVPHRHLPDLAATNQRERMDLARVLRRVLRQFDALFQRPAPYLLTWIQAPARADREVAHAYVEIVCPVRSAGRHKQPASGELGAGAYVNEVCPERAAAALRDAGPPGRGEPPPRPA
jgi:UDPglucose--hexose-1-phosphate uridylyltransferase